MQKTDENIQWSNIGYALNEYTLKIIPIDEGIHSC